MKVRVLREACCGADDQLGPLELLLEVEPSCTWERLVRQVLDARFLQFSSSHTVLIGWAGGRAVLWVRAVEGAREEPIFLLSPSDPVSEALGQNCLDFRFRR